MRKIVCSLSFLLLITYPDVLFSEGVDSYIKVKSLSKIKKENITLQSLDYSCGAASMIIILHRYFNDIRLGESELLDDILLRLSENDVKDRAENGFSMLDLKNVANRIGYIANGVILPKEAVYKLKGPIIILLNKKDIKHFVVLKGAKGGRAFIADPAGGEYRIPLHQLYDEWQGESLILGREEFGLPEKHTLALPPNNTYAPEQEVARTALRVKFMNKNNWELYRLNRF